MADKKVLTVSLLSSGRIDTIERCLSSLTPLREGLDTEVIVVDTDAGHDPKVRQIVERFADKIIDFEWCNDFSAARNVGMSAASGEWFFYLDDDEWLIDSQALIDFLRLADGGNPSWVNLLVRNYFNDELSEFSDAWVTRLVRIQNGIRFVGRVHEYFDPLSGKPKAIMSVLGHTGYIFHSKEALDAHLKRNISLLEEAIKENPLELRFRHQLLQEYEASGNVEGQKRLCDDALSLLSKTKDVRLDPMRGLFFAAKLRIFRNAGDSGRELRFFEKNKRLLKHCGTVAGAYISLEAATLYVNSDDYEKAGSYVLSYMESYYKNKDDDSLISVQGLYFLADTYSNEMYSLACKMQREILIKRLENAKDSNSNAYDVEIAAERKLLYSQIMEKIEFLEKAGRNEDAHRMRAQLLKAMEGR
ncbi:MAG: glycosyltransferase [Lachnospiraceae bacterium]|nr:glycosyltransferase [Lachnospiraceae bacterium]